MVRTNPEIQLPFTYLLVVGAVAVVVPEGDTVVVVIE